jgi:hypothetical protein
MVRQSQATLTSSAYACAQGASSCNSSADIAAGALKSFICTQVTICADAVPAFATGARARLPVCRDELQPKVSPPSELQIHLS